MRRALFLALVPALFSACAGPRLPFPATTARLPAPVVRRVDTPPRRIETLKTVEAVRTVESVKAVADVNAPVSGEVESINEDLVDNLERLANDPFGEGWLAKIKMSYPEEVDTLLSAADYEKFLEEEAESH